MNDEKEYYSVKEMALQQGVDPVTIYRWIKLGLKAEKRPRGRMAGLKITMDDMRDFLGSNQNLR